MKMKAIVYCQSYNKYDICCALIVDCSYMITYFEFYIWHEETGYLEKYIKFVNFFCFRKKMRK